MNLNIPLGETQAVKWVDGSNSYDLERLVFNGTTIWELATDITGTAVYNPISRVISMDVTLGNLDSWSWRAQKTYGSGDTGENAVSGVSHAESSEFGVSDDGTWTVTFKGFLNGTHRSTHQVSVVVATPFVEITSVSELGGGSAPLSPPASVGSFTYTWYFRSEIPILNSTLVVYNARALVINNADSTSGSCQIIDTFGESGPQQVNRSFNGTWSIDSNGHISGDIDGDAFNINKPVNGWKTSGTPPASDIIWGTTPPGYALNDDRTVLNWRVDYVTEPSQVPASTLMFPGAL